MSVLIEALSPVVPGKVLDVSYPGGSAMASHTHGSPAPSPVRWRCPVTPEAELGLYDRMG